MAGLDDVIAVTTARLEALETEAAREVPCFDHSMIRNAHSPPHLSSCFVVSECLILMTIGRH